MAPRRVLLRGQLHASGRSTRGGGRRLGKEHPRLRSPIYCGRGVKHTSMALAHPVCSAGERANASIGGNGGLHAGRCQQAEPILGSSQTYQQKARTTRIAKLPTAAQAVRFLSGPKGPCKEPCTAGDCDSLVRSEPAEPTFWQDLDCGPSLPTSQEHGALTQICVSWALEGSEGRDSN